MTMANGNRSKRTIEYGDFQTPGALATEACALLARRGVKPASILEPTCGTGSFLVAALDQFPQVGVARGYDIADAYVQSARIAVANRLRAEQTNIEAADFFTTDWNVVLGELAEPVLVVGNPPWVTNSRLGGMDAGNLPKKSNFPGYRGLEARTGKSNFDISEWMIIRLIDAMTHRRATLAMLCKTSVARKVLRHCWKNGIALERPSIYQIPAERYFGAAVEACFFVCGLGASASDEGMVCSVYGGIREPHPCRRVGYRDGLMVANLDCFDRWRRLLGEGPYQWRSGVKHDCTKVMELKKFGGSYLNGLGERVELEPECVYPLLKGSEVAKGGGGSDRWMLVPQRGLGDDTSVLAERAPRTWAYLVEHEELLHRRASSIYRNQPPFAVFGVGAYTFSPWKVAIGALAKGLTFRVIGPSDGKPVVFDDTTNFLACGSHEEADLLGRLLNSAAARGFFEAYVNWDAKRPITIDLLRLLNLHALAVELGEEESLLHYQAAGPSTRKSRVDERQETLFTLNR